MSSLSELGARCRERFFSINPDIEAVVTDDPVHIGYLSGYRSILHDAAVYTQALVATRDRFALITGASDGAAALEVLQDPSAIWRYGTFYVFASGEGPSYKDMPQASATPGDALAAALNEIAIGDGKVCVDLRRPELAAVVQSACTSKALETSTDPLKRSRAIKLPSELDCLRRASCITDDAIEAIRPMIRQGTTELEIAAEITRRIVAGGGIARFVVVTSGERSSRVDAYARDRKLEDGDIVRLDIGGTVNGYFSDMARSYAVGDPGSLARKRYESLLKGEKAELDLVRSGVSTKAVFEAAMDEVRSGALPDYQRNHCGHGIGLAAHEFPVIGPGSETILKSGMVLCVETPYYEIGWGGMMVEDTLIVTDSGFELLTKAARELCQSN